MKIELVSKNFEYRVSSRQIAEMLDVQHASVISLISDYKEDFETFGVIGFETEKPLAGSAGGRPTETAFLNEDQSYLFLTFSKNTDRARACKVALVQAFKMTRDSIQLPVKIPTTGEMFAQSAELIMSLERRTNAIEDRQAAVEAELALTTINSLEVKQISDSAKALARVIGKKYHLVWGEFNRHYNLASYRDLPRAKFMDALGWLRKWHDDVTRENNAGFIKGYEQ